MARARFWLRWSARDFREHWVQVTAIALVIAVGTGVYAGLGSTSTWRRESNDASYAALAVHDLRASLAEGSSVKRGRLLATLAALPPGAVADAEERLLVSTQVDASTPARTILVPGRLVGVDLTGAGPGVDGIHVEGGRRLGEADQASPVAVLEHHFAEYYDLPPEGRIRVGGGELGYVGTGLSPEYFLVTTRSGNLLAEANFAAVFVSLETAQALSGDEGMVNDLVVRLAPGFDRRQLAADLERAVTAGLPGAAVTVTTTEEDDAYRVLYEDIESDQEFWNAIAGLILVGAAVAAFNLASRLVEAQRRQIGMGMALGASPARIALRPLLVGLEVALLGTVWGVLVGLLVADLMRGVMSSLVPLPVWKTSFQGRFFARGAVLGLALPLVATAWPVWRAVRVAPVEALRTGHLARRGIRLAGVARRLPLPRGTFARMPVRNVLRAPRRTLLTAFGIGAAICALVGTLGMIDSFLATIDRGEEEVLRGAPDRLTVELTRALPLDSPAMAAITTSAAVSSAEPSIRVVGTLRAGTGEPIDVSVEAVDLRSGQWRPTLVDPVADLLDPTTAGGIVLAEKAARDLGVVPGDRVTLRHPRRVEGGLTLVETEIPVAALHPNPLRFTAYVDATQAEPLLGLGGFANLVNVRPAAGLAEDDVERALFGLPGVAAVQPVAAATELFRDTIDQFVGILRVVQAFVLVLALLIAFNATSINVDERARDHATMFAFGLRPRTVTRMNVVEGLLTGVLGTAIGLVLGVGVVRWIVTDLMPQTVPEIGLITDVSGATTLTALVVGVAAVSLAPLLTLPRLRRMDVPAMLRVIE